MGESLQVLWEDDDRVFCREWRRTADGESRAVLSVRPAADRPSPANLDRLAHHHEMKDELDGAWAARPLELVSERGRTMLLLEDYGGEPLARLLGGAMDLGRFLRLAIGIAGALGKAHQRGLIHKDLKPGHILVNCADGRVRLTGFGIASRLPRERQRLEPPETIAGTLAYMAPEQTGRMNRSIDSRSDLYSLGVTFYEMLTGSLPFAASDPMEWVHCHIARRPASPDERIKNVPAPVSRIVMKLLAKTAEERYQTASGAEHDLRRCLTDWEAHGRIDDFPLGERDTPDRLLIAEKLYGRAREVETLLASFDRVVASGAPELALVSGYSGIGKTSVVNELHKSLVSSRGLFASGKFDQYKRDIPYSTLAQAFQSLIRGLLCKSDAELALWRDAFVEALGANGRLMVDLVPELKLIIGDQPPVPELPPQEAQARFQHVLQRFIGVFTQPGYSLALFLDDLQWLDAATLDLVEDLLTRSDLRRLMLIGAYRDNEVDSTHPLMRKLESMKRAGAKIKEVTLAPLAPDDLEQLTADALRCDPQRAAPLAQLVHRKTAGNPFFVIQFLHALAEEGLVRFDHDAGCWSWDLDGIHAKGYTDNVVDLMVGKLTRLPAETQKALQQLACLGDLAGTEMLAIVLGTSEEDVGATLWEAVRQALVERLDESYMFSHDRVQEAAYSMIPAEARAEAHLLIGRLLAAQTPPEKREEAIFEIVNQLNRGAALITQQEERDQLAEFNLIAGKRAKGSTAYASALAYLAAGAALLAEECWERRRELTFALELNRAECEFLTGALAKAEQRLAALSMRAATTVERATVACLRVDLYTTLGQGGRAIAVGLDYLRPLGIDWSPHPTVEEVRREYAQIWSQLGGRSIEDLVDLPLMSDPAWLATLDVLIRIVPPAVFTDANLPSLVFCRAVNLSLEHGNSDASCYAYTQLATVLGPHVGDYQTGFRFGQLGHELVERRGLRRFEARTYLQRGYLTVWTRHVRAGRDLLRRGFDAANQIGDLTHAAYTCDRLNANMLAAGDPLVDVQREAEIGFGFAQKVRFDFAMELISPQLGLVRTLRGLTRKFGTFDDDQFDELGIERRFASNLDLQLAECWYWIRKLQARFFAGDHSSAIEASSRAQPLLWTSVSQFETAEYHFYGALSRAAAFDAASADERQQHLEALAAHHSQLKMWTENCPENFENRAALVGAEIARIEGRDVDAMRLYEQAIRSARDNGFVHNEAIAYERASDFYGARGFDQIADLYLRNARCGYVRWGADAKVRRLEETYPRLRMEEPAAPGPTSTMAAAVERLDLATVIKVSQAVSSEMVLEKLIDTLMRTAIAQAGAERGLLILSREAEPRIEAEAAVSGDTVVVELRDAPVAASVLPETVLHFVLRVRESLILDDAGADASFAVDPYIRQHKARSIACLPLINQAKLVGVLYLENNLTARAFAPARIAVLKLLASQAAISLENTRLYRDLEQREAKIRGLVDANIIGIGLLGGDGRILEANDALLRLVGYDRQDLLSGRIRWMDLTPPEWWERSAQAATELAMTGAVRPFEKEYFHKDGSRVPVLVGLARIEGTGHQHVAFMLDLTERKRAEQALRRSEASLAEGQRLTRTGTWIYNPTKRETIYWSDEQFRIHGLSPQKDLPDTEVLERQLHPEDRRRVLARFAKAFRDKTDVEEDFRIVLNDGTIKHLHAVGHSVTDGTGELVEFIGTAVDVTERKRAEEALRRSEAYLAEAQRLSHTGSWARNANGETTHCSEEHSRLYGFDPELGVPSFEAFAERIHPEDRAKVTEIFRRAIGERTDFAMDFRTALPDGTLKYIHGVGHPVFDGAGELVEYIGTAVDVTERKRAEQALARSEKKLRDVIETIPAMAWTTLPDGSNDFANQRWVKLTGISSKASSGEGWKAWVHPADMAIHIEKWRASLASGEPFENEARIQRASDGEYRWFLHRAVPLRDESGNILKWYGISTEIDDRKRAEALLVGEKRILEMVAKGDSLAQILESLCRLVEEQASGVLASILLLDGDRLRQGGAPSLPKGYTDAIDGVLVGYSAGSCGTAAYRGEPVIVEDIATDPLWAEAREAALSYSLRACWSTPIFSSRGKVIGTIAMYYREPRSPSPRDQENVEQITHLAGIAIERKTTQEALRRSEAHLAEAQRLTGQLGLRSFDRGNDLLVRRNVPNFWIGSAGRPE